MRNANLPIRQKREIAILGFGAEGQSVLRFLKRSPEYKNAEIWILDKNTALKKPAGKNIYLQLGASYLKNLPQFDVISRSPGIPYLTPEIQKARRAGSRISSVTKLFFNEFLKRRRGGSPILIGVTGSKGKGTTCTLLNQIFTRAGKKTLLLGNIGKPMLDSLASSLRADIVILELSSFQLQDIEQSPDIAVIVDTFPEHLDHHKTIKEYVDAKANIARFQTPKNAVFYFKNNAMSSRMARAGHGRKIGVMPKEKGVRKNYDIARAVAKYLGIKKSVVESTIKSFKGLEHRLELVRTILLKQHTNKLQFVGMSPQKHSNILQNVRMSSREHSDILKNVGMTSPRYSHVLKNMRISFYNDTTATNPHATAAAIQSFRNPIVLIAGGRDKGLDYGPLARAVKRAKNLKTIILYGENKKKLVSILKPTKKEIVVEKNNLLAVVRRAYREAQQVAIRYKLPTIILFSPAATSFDMFKNYKDRGLQFKKAVRAL